VYDSNSPTNPRVTDLIIYILEAETGDEEMPDDLPLRFVRRIDVTDSEWQESSGTFHALSAAVNPEAVNEVLDNNSIDEVLNPPPDTQPETISTFEIDGNEVDIDGVEVDVEVTVEVDASDPPNQDGEAIARVDVALLDGNDDTVSDDYYELKRTVGDTRDNNPTETATILLDDFPSDNVETLEVTATANLNDVNNKGDGSVYLRSVAKVTEQRVSEADQNDRQKYLLSLGGTNEDVFKTGQTYMERTGISRAVAKNSVTQYQHAISSGPYRVIAGAEIDATIGADTTKESYVLRSKAYRPDMFDWATDFAQVGQSVRALASYKTFVLAFCETDTYVIDRDEWRLIDRLTNVTAFGPRASTPTPRGLVFCDKNGVYLYQPQNGYQVLTAPIYERTLSSNPTDYNAVPQYKGAVTQSTFKGLAYDANRELLVLAYDGDLDNDDTNDTYGWAMHLPAPSSYESRPTPHWTHFSSDLFPSNTTDMYEQGGSIYASKTGGIAELLSNTQQSWQWVSAPLAPGGFGRETVFYRADLSATGDELALKYCEDENGGFISTPLSGSDPQKATVNSGAGSPPHARATRLEVSVEGGGDNTFSGLGLTYRPLRPATDDA